MITKILTKQAITSFHYANTLAHYKGRKTIGGDELFWGAYLHLCSTQQRILFCNLMGITEDREEFFKEEYTTTHTQLISETHLPIQKTIFTRIKDFVNNNKGKIDTILLFYIGLSHLSIKHKKHIKHLNIDIKKAKDTCEIFFENPLISQQGIIAFLEILTTLLDKLHLSPKNLEIMHIQNINNLEDIHLLMNTVDKEIMDKNESSVGEGTPKTNKKEEKKLNIEYFGTDLTKEVKDGMIDPIIGREQEINQMIYTLLRKNKNNPLLIGEAGVGKTAVVEGLAQKIVADQVPEKLKNKRIFALDMGSLVAGTKYRGEFESRIKSILEEAMDPTNNIILFIDEIHTMIGAGGQENGDAAQMIKPLLSRGKIKLIGATTFNEFQKYIEKDAALKRRFQEVIVNEPDNETSEQILIGLKQTYEDFHGVAIDTESIKAAILLSKRYLLNKHLPDKALDLIDEACAKKSTMSTKLEQDESYQECENQIQTIQKKIEEAIEKQDYFGAASFKEQEDTIKKQMLTMRTQKNIPTHLRPQITKDDIGNVLAEKLGIPTNIVNENEIDKLKRLEFSLKGQIIGQDEAVDAIVRTLTRSRLSMVNSNKPMGSFLFLGPSGVGKTYLAKLIAKEYFGDEKALVRFDMSEFMEKYSVSKLIGSPAGYVGYDEGGNLTEAIRRKPYSVILFDEIEKASPDVLNILLQMLDEGQLKDSKGRLVDFKSTIIIMTGNIGSEEFSKKQTKIGFATTEVQSEIDDQRFNDIKTRVLEDLKNYLTPELINRIDYKIVFKPLTKDHLTSIMTTKLDQFLAARKSNPDIKLPKYSKKHIKEMIDELYEPAFGARPLERYITEKLEPEIINTLLK